MAHRTILTDRQKSALFDLPTDEPSLLKHYTLADDDLEYINQRRRAHNKLGFALQLCALRYPGRPLGPGEVIPHEVSLFLAAQLGLKADDLIEYATREETRHDHMSALRSIYGYRAFSGRAARDLKLWLDGQAEDARSNEDLARRLVEECRRSMTILPVISTIERLCANSLVAAEHRIEGHIAGRLNDTSCKRLDSLLVELIDGHLSRFVWLRKIEPGKNSADINRLLDRLSFLQNLGLSPGILANIPPHRVARLKRQGERYFADGLSDCIFRDIRPPIPTTSAHLYRGIRPALTRCREALVFDISFLAFRHVVEGLSFGRIVRRVRAGRRCAPAGRGWHLRRWVHQ